MLLLVLSKNENVELVYFPSNMTSQCQPLDQGVIHQFKKLYCTQLLRKAVVNLDTYQLIGCNLLGVLSHKKHSTRDNEEIFLRSGFRRHGNKVTDIDDLLSPLEELGNLIMVIDNNITENDYINTV